MKKAVLLVAILVVAVFAEKIAFRAEGRVDGGFILSYMMPDLSKLSSEFTAHGLPSIDDDIVTYGGGCWGGKKNLMFGGWGFGGARRFDSDSVSVRMTYGGGFFEPGYFIKIYKGFSIVPSLGLGMTRLRLEMREILGDVDFDSLLLDPSRTSKATYRTFTAAPALAINIPIEFVSIQVKGGYMWSPLSGKWRIEDGSDLRDTPEIDPSGVFASAGLMLGGY
jgi:hypothetical protein